MNRLALIIVIVIVIANGAVACRAHLPEEPARNAVSLSTAALASRTLSASYERQLSLDPRFSVAASPGLRWGAYGDYSSRTLALAGEGRYWLTGAPMVRSSYRRQMVGFYVGARLGLAHTRTRADDRGVIGSAIELSETATVGYRVILFRRVELTFSQGLQARHEFDRRSDLPPWSNFGFTFGGTAGVVFR